MKSPWISGLGIAALVATAWLAQGCDSWSCTEMGCGYSLSMKLEPPLQQEGSYEIIFLLPNDESLTCNTAIPRQPDEECVDTAQGSNFAHFIRQSNGAIERLDFLEPVPSLDLVIRRDGREIIRTTVEPSYDTYYPNGEACDYDWGGCKRASVRIDLPTPSAPAEVPQARGD